MSLSTKNVDSLKATLSKNIAFLPACLRARPPVHFCAILQNLLFRYYYKGKKIVGNFRKKISIFTVFKYSSTLTCLTR